MKRTVFHVTSSEDLEKQVADAPQSSVVRYAILSIADPSMVIYSFALEKASAQKFRSRIIKEAAGLLSLPEKDIIYDYQILRLIDDKFHGVLACMPRKNFETYIRLLNKKKFVLICAMPTVVAAANAFLEDHQEKTGRIGFLNFLPSQKIQCAIFFNQQCEFLREIPYDSLDGVRRDIVQTLKSVYAKSAVKQFDHIYFSGTPEHKSEIIEWIESQFHTAPQELEAFDPLKAICNNQQRLSVNLSKRYSFVMTRRRGLLKFLNILLILLLLAACVLAVRIYLNQSQLKQLKGSFDAAAYEEAVNLENMLK